MTSHWTPCRVPSLCFNLGLLGETRLRFVRRTRASVLSGYGQFLESLIKFSCGELRRESHFEHRMHSGGCWCAWCDSVRLRSARDLNRISWFLGRSATSFKFRAHRLEQNLFARRNHKRQLGYSRASAMCDANKNYVLAVHRKFSVVRNCWNHLCRNGLIVACNRSHRWCGWALHADRCEFTASWLIFPVCWTTHANRCSRNHNRSIIKNKRPIRAIFM
jgi:hypothetical protein